MAHTKQKDLSKHRNVVHYVSTGTLILSFPGKRESKRTGVSVNGFSLSREGRDFLGCRDALQCVSTKRAFTLVELIVVIVILAILATVSFLAYGKQTSAARDSVRLSEIAAVSDGLRVRNDTAGKYPLPDKPVNILSNSVLIGYQGEVGSSVKKVINASADGFKDPLDKTNYTYSISKTKDRYRVSTFLENKKSTAMNYDIDLNGGFSESSYALDYDSTRTLYGVGDNVPVVISSTGETITPIQDVTGSAGGVLTSTGIDIATAGSTNSGIVAVSSNSGSLKVVSAALAGVYNPSTYGDCDTEDIVLDNGQVWAACNVGASKAGTGSENRGSYFSWGNSSPLSESNKVLGNKDGWTIGGKGPCETGYHIPIKNDFTILINTYSDPLILINKLYMPVSFRYYDESESTDDGVFFWTSEFNQENLDNGWEAFYAFKIWGASDFSTPETGTDGFTYWDNIRCIKD